MLWGLQLREAHAQPLGALRETQPQSVDAALAHAHQYLVKGQLQEAAHVLELSVAGELSLLSLVREVVTC